MLSFLHVSRWILWIVPVVLQTAIVVVIVRRKLTGIFPVFFAYTVVVASRDITLLFLPYPGNSYALVYWLGEAFAVVLGIGIVLEIVRYLLPPYRYLKSIYTSLWMLGGLVAVVALSFTLFSHHRPGVDRILETILLLERAARFLQVCLLVVVIALMSRLGLSWHHYSLGIVAGFGIYSALDLSALELRAHLHFVSDTAFVLVRPAAYNLGTAIWAAYFLRPWRSSVVEHLPKHNLADWNQAVTEYLDQWYPRY